MELVEDFINLIKPLSISLVKCDELLPHAREIRVSEDAKENIEQNNSSILRQRTNFYVCSYPGCSKLFGKHSRLIVHERNHTGERPFTCSFVNCDKSYKRKAHLDRHFSSHNAAQESKDDIRCNECQKSFNDTYALKKHKSRFHGVQKRFPCTECGQTFRKQQHLVTHSFMHTGIKPYKCNFPGCESAYDIPSRLKRHAQSHLRGRYRCTYDACAAEFKTYVELRHHLTEAHPKVCDVCGSTFSSLSKLRPHLLSHQTIREVYFCPYTPCERYYCYEKNLRSHIHINHNENFKGYECRLCSKWFVTKQKLKTHLITHDPHKPEKKRDPKKRRKPRKDKGVSRTDFAKLLSGYTDEERMTQPQSEAMVTSSEETCSTKEIGIMLATQNFSVSTE